MVMPLVYPGLCIECRWWPLEKVSSRECTDDTKDGRDGQSVMGHINYY